MTTAYQFIVRFIKENPGSTEKQIINAYLKAFGDEAPIRVTAERIWAADLALAELKKTGTLDESKGIRFQRILDPIPAQKRQAGFWEMDLTPPAGAEPPSRTKIRNIVKIDLAPRDQGDRGTCVGQAWAHAKDILYALLNPVTDLDKMTYQKDVTDPSGVVHDILFYPSYSAEDVYQTSRRIGHVTYPSGSCTSCGAKALVQEGVAYESDWPTSKTPKHVYLQAPTTTTRGEHKIDGYTQKTTPAFNEVQTAIQKYGLVVGSFVIYENYSTMRGGDGTFPDPKGMETGAHAMCCYDYDDNWIYLIHSWGDWCGRLGKMSSKYIARGCMDIFAPIDATEAARYRENYVKVEFMANADANFYVDGKYLGTFRTGSPVSGQLRKGKEVTIYGEALDYYNVNREEKFTPEADGIFVMRFDLTPPPEDNWLVRLIKWLRSLAP